MFPSEGYFECRKCEHKEKIDDYQSSTTHEASEERETLIIEGDLEHILALAGRMHRSAFDAGVMRVVTTIRIDERHDKPLTMDGKIAAVKKRLEQ